MKEIMGLSKRIILKLAIITIAAGLLPLQAAFADEGGIDCTLTILGLGMPEIDTLADIPVETDKANIFKSALENVNMGKPLISGPDVSFELVGGEVEEPQKVGDTEQLDTGLLDAEIAEFEPSSLNKRDILKAVPSISTKDDKTLGILVPPFAYFSKKF